jgi:hypothetical protein
MTRQGASCGDGPGCAAAGHESHLQYGSFRALCPVKLLPPNGLSGSCGFSGSWSGSCYSEARAAGLRPSRGRGKLLQAHETRWCGEACAAAPSESSDPDARPVSAASERAVTSSGNRLCFTPIPLTSDLKVGNEPLPGAPHSGLWRMDRETQGTRRAEKPGKGQS